MQNEYSVVGSEEQLKAVRRAETLSQALRLDAVVLPDLSVGLLKNCTGDYLEVIRVPVTPAKKVLIQE